MGNDGILVSLTEPTETNIGKFTWLQILADGTRKWYERSDGDWALVKTELGGISVDLTEDHVRITRIKIVNGLITEFESD